MHNPTERLTSVTEYFEQSNGKIEVDHLTPNKPVSQPQLLRDKTLLPTETPKNDLDIFMRIQTGSKLHNMTNIHKIIDEIEFSYDKIET